MTLSPKLKIISCEYTVCDEDNVSPECRYIRSLRRLQRVYYVKASKTIEYNEKEIHIGILEISKTIEGGIVIEVENIACYECCYDEEEDKFYNGYMLEAIYIAPLDSTIPKDVEVLEVDVETFMLYYKYLIGRLLEEDANIDKNELLRSIDVLHTLINNLLKRG